MEKECDYKTHARKRTRKRLYHGLVSRKASHYKKVLAYPDDFNTDYYTENYADTEEEEHQYGDIAGITVFSQHGLNPPQENQNQIWTIRSGVITKTQVTGERFDARNSKGRISNFLKC